jgi:hypothetical protein
MRGHCIVTPRRVQGFNPDDFRRGPGPGGRGVHPDIMPPGPGGGSNFDSMFG